MTWGEFAAIALVHALGVFSPGPDLALVLRQSLVAGLIPALLSSWGIALGIGVHALYTLIGGAWLQEQYSSVYLVIRWAGVAYLLYLGIRLLLTQPGAMAVADKGWGGHFMNGVLVNLTNIKVAMFFVAVLSVMVPTSATEAERWWVTLYLCFATGMLFCAVTLLLSRVKISLERLYWVERITGAALIIVALTLILDY